MNVTYIYNIERMITHIYMYISYMYRCGRRRRTSLYGLFERNNKIEKMII